MFRVELLCRACAGKRGVLFGLKGPIREPKTLKKGNKGLGFRV